METPPTARPAVPDRLEHLEQSEEFRQLRSSFRGFAFPVTAGFLLWYLLYVLLSNYAPDFMAIKLFGHINVALALGLLQFVSTFTIAALYARYAGRRLDPRATAIREGRTTATLPNPRRAAS
ncbi:DUF485 domain-containing protein [Streptomyces sp. BE20]|uniref:DUF485 domain-containing protein n=1 Tax=unclassified Streptomyces TaxID=2593676 RepID=UPI002E765F63|nr:MULTISPECIES: DUF485 domain-containing protein [unclassified Streptomyces]MED7952049.1 DUF485 domain-containing protein [Streptomyces sp. BE303]MEE1821080.1 DUF485 domain-containing protein [Streptomyces sp. BE20]